MHIPPKPRLPSVFDDFPPIAQSGAPSAAGVRAAGRSAGFRHKTFLHPRNPKRKKALPLHHKYTQLSDFASQRPRPRPLPGPQFGSAPPDRTPPSRPPSGKIKITALAKTKTMKFGVIVFPGSNCDHDACYAVAFKRGQPAE